MKKINLNKRLELKGGEIMLACTIPGSPAGGPLAGIILLLPLNALTGSNSSPALECLKVIVN